MLLKKIFALSLGATAIGSSGAIVSYLNKPHAKETLSSKIRQDLVVKNSQGLSGKAWDGFGGSEGTWM